MSQIVHIHPYPGHGCTEFTVYCSKCGEVAVKLCVQGRSSLKALAQYRKLILEVHNQVEHEELLT